MRGNERMTDYNELTGQTDSAWKVVEFLYFHQACLLALGFDPNNDNTGRGSTNHPLGYTAIYQAIVEDVSSVLQIANGVDGDLEKMESVLNRSDIIQPDKGNRYTEFYRIRQSAFKNWIENKRFESEYFLTEDKGKKTVVGRFKPEYQTRLMAIMYETINRYYGENYDPNDRDSVTKQADLVEWLETTYSLSNAEARAIDKMTRPEQSKSPQGKK